MKFNLALFIAVVFSAPAFANTVETVFLPNSALPQDLKARVLARVYEKCSAGILKYGMKEENTIVSEKVIDQGVRDLFFETSIRTTYYFDGMHPTFAFITVKSAQYSVSNPSVDPYEILEVSADADICIK